MRAICTNLRDYLTFVIFKEMNIIIITWVFRWY